MTDKADTVYGLDCAKPSDPSLVAHTVKWSCVSDPKTWVVFDEDSAFGSASKSAPSRQDSADDSMRKLAASQRDEICRLRQQLVVMGIAAASKPVDKRIAELEADLACMEQRHEAYKATALARAAADAKRMAALEKEIAMLRAHPVCVAGASHPVAPVAPNGASLPCQGFGDPDTAPAQAAPAAAPPKAPIPASALGRGPMKIGVFVR